MLTFANSPTRNQGVGERTQRFLESIPHYRPQSEALSRTDAQRAPSPPARTTVVRPLPTPRQAAAEPVDLLAIPDFLKRAKKA